MGTAALRMKGAREERSGLPVTRGFGRRSGRWTKAGPENHRRSFHLVGVDHTIAVSIEVQRHLANWRRELFERQLAVEIPVEVIERHFRVERRMPISGPGTTSHLSARAVTLRRRAVRAVPTHTPMKFMRTAERRRRHEARMGKLFGIQSSIVVGVCLFEAGLQRAVDFFARDSSVLVEIELGKRDVNAEVVSVSSAIKRWRARSVMLELGWPALGWRRAAALLVVGPRGIHGDPRQETRQQ